MWVMLFRDGSSRALVLMQESTSSSSITPPNKEPNDIEKANLD